jgi:hypothetical protein
MDLEATSGEPIGAEVADGSLTVCAGDEIRIDRWNGDEFGKKCDGIIDHGRLLLEGSSISG